MKMLPGEVVPPSEAVTVVVPGVSAVAVPVLSMVATVGAELDQLTWPVRSWVVPSEYTPVAVKAWVVPLAIEAEVGATCRAVSKAGVTMRVAPW